MNIDRQALLMGSKSKKEVEAQGAEFSLLILEGKQALYGDRNPSRMVDTLRHSKY